MMKLSFIEIKLEKMPMLTFILNSWGMFGNAHGRAIFHQLTDSIILGERVEFVLPSRLKKNEENIQGERGIAITFFYFFKR